MVSGHGEDGCMFDRAIQKDDQVCRSASDIDNGRPHFFLLRSQHSFARAQLFQDDIIHIEAGAVGAFDDILGRGNGAGDDVNPPLQSHP